MALRGKLSEASLADVLQLLALGHKTGCLSIAREDAFGEIHFEQGRIAHAALVNRRERLGDRLVRAGLVVPDTLARLIANEAPADDRALAAVLIERGIVEADDLEPHHRALVEEAVYQMFGWSSGTFTFESYHANDVPPSQLSISADSLLLEGARRVDEWAVIEKKVPGLDLIFEADAARIAGATDSMSEAERRMVPLLDGTSDLQAVVERTGLSEFDVAKAVFGLLSAGLVQRVGRSNGRYQPPPESRVAEHRNLGIAFYRTGLWAEAEREFRRVLDLRAEDISARFHLALVQMRRNEWTEAEATLRAAAAEPDARAGIFLNLAYVLERMGKFDDARTALDEAERRAAAAEPRVALSRATIALRTGDIDDALMRLDEARSHWGDRQPSAAWYHLAGLVHALKGDTARAAALLEEGLTVHPHESVLHNNLAVVHERRGSFELAARTIEHALLEDSSLAHLHKNLGDYLYRAQRYDEAHEAYVRVVRLDPRHGSDVYLKLGNICYRRGAQADALRCWQQAKQIDPDHPIVNANLQALARSGSVQLDLTPSAVDAVQAA